MTISATPTAKILQKHAGQFPAVQTDGDTINRQTALEAACLGQGRENYNDKGKPLDETAAGRRMLEDLVTAAIDAALAKHVTKPPGWRAALQIMPADKLALIAAQMALACTVPEKDGDTYREIGYPVTALSRRIGRRCYEAARYHALIDAIRARCKVEGVTKPAEIKAAIRDGLGCDPQYMDSPEKFDEWLLAHPTAANEIDGSEEDWIQLGRKLLDLLVKADDRFEIKQPEKVSKGREQQLEFRMKPDAAKALFDLDKRAADAMPVLLPMLVRPIPWRYQDGREIGGYRLLRQDMVSTGLHAHTRELYEPVSQDDLTALNALQNVPWRINERVLNVMAEAYGSGAPWLGVRDGSPYPDKADKVAFRLARQQTIRTHVLADRLIVAELFRGEPAIYFPHNRDFRGRVYPLPMRGPHPQADDAGRALLTFADAKELGPRGWYWLRWWVATCFGQDKLPAADRMAWADANMAMIRRTAQSPHTEREWTAAKDSWQALAACIEIDSALNLPDPTQFASALPVYCDATCSGLQHLTALALDPDLAALVNLAGGIRQDAYKDVAEAAQEQITKDLAGGNAQKRDNARIWDGKVDRDLAKQPTMTCSYGSTESGIRQQIRDKLKDGDVTIDAPDYATESAAVTYLADVFCHVREAVMPTAMRIRDWLEETAEALAIDGKPMEWTTPTGSRVRQACHKIKSDRIRAGASQIRLTRPLPDLDVKKQRQGAVPNYIHSLDGALVHLTVNGCVAEGVEHITTIHDCFGSRAADFDVLNRVLRERMAAMYETNRLAELRRGLASNTVKAPPGRGDFDLSAVLDAEHAFS